MNCYTDKVVQQAVRTLFLRIDDGSQICFQDPKERSNIVLICNDLLSMNYDHNPIMYMNKILQVCYISEQNIFTSDRNTQNSVMPYYDSHGGIYTDHLTSELYHVDSAPLANLYYIFALLIVNFCSTGVDQEPMIYFNQYPKAQLQSINQDEQHPHTCKFPKLAEFVSLSVTGWQQSMHCALRHMRKIRNLQGFIEYLQTTPLLDKPVGMNGRFIQR